MQVGTCIHPAHYWGSSLAKVQIIRDARNALQDAVDASEDILRSAHVYMQLFPRNLWEDATLNGLTEKVNQDCEKFDSICKQLTSSSKKAGK